jgi:hypothetical protein
MMRRLGLRRRYGHSTMAKVREEVGDIGKMATDHPIVTAAALGAGGGLLIAELGAAPGMAIGAIMGVVIEKVTGK